MKFRLCALLVLGILVSQHSLSPFVSAADDELVFVFQKQKDPAQVKQAAERVAEYLEEKLERKVRVQVPLDYAASVQALVSKKADFAYFSSLPFLLAQRDGDAKILLAEQRVGPDGVARTEYDSVFVVRKDSPLQTMADLKEKAETLRMVFTSPTSTSGFVFAFSRLVAEGVLRAEQDPKRVFKTVHFGGGYSQAVQEVIAGRGDVAAVSFYAVEGESATKYLTEEELAQVRVLDRTPGVPTHVVAVRGGLDAELAAQVKKALLELSSERPELLSDVYGTARLVEVDPQGHVQATKLAVQRLGLPIEGLQ